METSVVSASNWRVMPLDHVGADTERVGSWPTERFADGHKDRAIRMTWMERSPTASRGFGGL